MQLKKRKNKRIKKKQKNGGIYKFWIFQMI